MKIKFLVPTLTDQQSTLIGQHNQKEINYVIKKKKEQSWVSRKKAQGLTRVNRISNFQNIGKKKALVNQKIHRGKGSL